MNEGGITVDREPSIYVLSEWSAGVIKKHSISNLHNKIGAYFDADGSSCRVH